MCEQTLSHGGYLVGREMACGFMYCVSLRRSTIYIWFSDFLKDEITVDEIKENVKKLMVIS